MQKQAAAAPAVPVGAERTGAPVAEPLVNLAALLSRWRQQAPDAVALVEPRRRRTVLTWSALDQRVEEVAAGLTAQGLLAGHRLALLSGNSTAFVVAYFAALRAGVVAVPLNPQSTSTEIAALLADSGARVLLAEPGLLEHQPAEVTVLPLSEEGLAGIARAGGTVSSPPDPETLAVLLYTAGTSGRPKAAMLTHRALLAHVEHVHRLGMLDAESVVGGSLPLFHVFGLNAVLGSWARSGSRLVVLEGYGEDFVAVLRAEGVTTLPLAPPVLQRLLADPASEQGLGVLESVVAGAAPLPEGLAAEFAARTGVRVDRGYGLTEAAPGVTLGLGDGATGQGYVGSPLPGVELRIGDGRDPSEPGEVAVRGDNLFSGYWPHGTGGPDEQGWFRTGDIGYLEDGGLYLVDRARELVIVNGFNVYPAEVEQVILELPDVAAVAVVGRPDPRTGEQVVAFVAGEPTSDPGAGAGPLARRVEEHCADRLARFKRPTSVSVLPELPRGATGKVRKGLLREMLGTAEAR